MWFYSLIYKINGYIYLYIFLWDIIVLGHLKSWCLQIFMNSQLLTAPHCAYTLSTMSLYDLGNKLIRSRKCDLTRSIIRLYALHNALVHYRYCSLSATHAHTLSTLCYNARFTSALCSTSGNTKLICIRPHANTQTKNTLINP